MKWTVACLVLIWSILPAACAPSDPAQGAGDEPPDEEPYLTGKVVSLQKTGASGSIHLRGRPGNGGEPEAVATVSGEVPLVRETGAGAFEAVSFDDIAEGDTVSLWITGPVRESFPVQVDASFIAVQE